MYSDARDTLNDIFMYRTLNRHATKTTTTTTTATKANQANNASSNGQTHVVVFKCLNEEAKLLVDNIRNAYERPPRNLPRYVK